jgi:hypothetical protein
LDPEAKWHTQHPRTALNRRYRRPVQTPLTSR